jgi:hypothetical protein
MTAPHRGISGTGRRKAAEPTRPRGDRLQRRAVKGPITRIDIPDEVLNRLTELAGIDPGIGLWGPHKQFAADVVNKVHKVHGLGHILNARKIEYWREIARHAEELVKLLKATDEEHLFALASADTVQVIARLGRGARRVGKLANAPRQSKWLIKMRNDLVEGLLNAAARAGGQLRLSTSQGNDSSLVEALDLLQDYLPAELSDKRSFATLRLIYDPWLKKVRQTYPSAKKHKK